MQQKVLLDYDNLIIDELRVYKKDKYNIGIQKMALQFPQSPTLGDLFLADNAITYVWTGVAWDSSIPIHNGTASYMDIGGIATTVYTVLDNTLDGGTA